MLVVVGIICLILMVDVTGLISQARVRVLNSHGDKDAVLSESSLSASSSFSHLSLIEEMEDKALTLTRESYAAYLSRTDGGAAQSSSSSGTTNDKDGLWINNGLLKELKDLLNNTMINETSDLLHMFSTSKYACTATLVKDLAVEISLLTVPSGGIITHCPRRHSAGTVLLLKKLYGDCQMRNSIITENIRDGSYKIRSVKEEVLPEADILYRMAGLSKTLESRTMSPAAVLEIALFGPSNADEGMSEESAHIVELSKHIVSLNLQESEMKDHLLQPLSDLDFTEMTSLLEEDTQKPVDGAMSSVGGMSRNVNEIVRRVLSSRRIPSNLFNAMQIDHIKGVLLHGPPGCGKTLIARHMASLLGCRNENVQVINGPEIFNKYVGEAERTLREVFKDADEAWEKFGDKSELFVIIMDEFDAIGKTRSGGSSDGASVRDSIVNTLLTKMDGVQERNNIVVIATTNRKDLIDKALLRPGRFEVHLSIESPSKEGRGDILDIHTHSLRKEGILLDQDYENIKRYVVGRTRSFSGAEIAAIVRSACSFAIERTDEYMPSIHTRKRRSGEGEILDSIYCELLQVKWTDFVRAIDEIKIQRATTATERVLRRLQGRMR